MNFFVFKSEIYPILSFSLFSVSSFDIAILYPGKCVNFLYQLINMCNHSHLINRTAIWYQAQLLLSVICLSYTVFFKNFIKLKHQFFYPTAPTIIFCICNNFFSIPFFFQSPGNCQFQFVLITEWNQHTKFWL